MPAYNLTDREKLIIGQCLACVASGDVLKDDSEFETLFGISFAELCSVSAAWPNVVIDDQVAELAVENSMVNLLGYPHGRSEIWGTRIAATPPEIDAMLPRVRQPRRILCYGLGAMPNKSLERTRGK